MLKSILKLFKKEKKDSAIGRTAYTTRDFEWKGKIYPSNTKVVITEVDNGSCGRGYGFQFPDGNLIAETGWSSVRFEEDTC